MIDLHSNQFWLMKLVIITFFVEKCLSLNVCPTAVWSSDATTRVGSKSDEASSNSSILNWPTTIYIDNNNTIYVLDSGNFRVQRYLSNSNEGTTVPTSVFGSGYNQIRSMTSMTIDLNSSIYILDGVLGRVTKWTEGNGDGTIVAGGNGSSIDVNQMNEPYGMFVDSNTLAIWIADTNNHRIIKWSSPVTSVVVCGSNGTGNDQFMNPKGLFVDTINLNTLYVADTNNHRIQMWLPGSTTGITVAGITSYYGNGLNQLRSPQTLIVDGNKNMFIVDLGNNRIIQWKVGAYQGIIIAGGFMSGNGANQLNLPMSISFDSNGSLFVADTVNNRIQKFDISCPMMTNISTATFSSMTTGIPNQNVGCSMITWSPNATTIAGSMYGLSGSNPMLLNKPNDVFIDNNNTIYILDTGNNRIQRIQSDSTQVTTVLRSDGGNALNQSVSMNSIYVDSYSNLYVLDTGNFRVTKWTSNATNGLVVAGGYGKGNDTNQLNYPGGMFIGLNPSIIWIADTGNSRIVRWNSSSTGVIVYGSNGTANNQFYNPLGLFIDESSSDTIYVADTYNHRIQMWLPRTNSGITVAGRTGIFGNELSLLFYPSTLVLDSNGFMFILDSGNNRIVRWIKESSSGMIIAGISSYGNLPSQLYFPSSFKIDRNGNLIVADTFNNRIQKFSVSCVPNMISTSSRMPMVRVTSNPVPTIELSSTPIKTPTMKSNSPSSASLLSMSTRITAKLHSYSSMAPTSLPNSPIIDMSRTTTAVASLSSNSSIAPTSPAIRNSSMVSNSLTVTNPTSIRMKMSSGSSMVSNSLIVTNSTTVQMLTATLSLSNSFMVSNSLTATNSTSTQMTTSAKPISSSSSNPTTVSKTAMTSGSTAIVTTTTRSSSSSITSKSATTQSSILVLTSTKASIITTTLLSNSFTNSTLSQIITTGIHVDILATTGRSFASIDYYSNWSLVIFCSIMILFYN